MSTGSGFRQSPWSIDYDDISHTFCGNAPRNAIVPSVSCCGKPVVEELGSIDTADEITCPMCADLYDELSPLCACWWTED